MKSKNIINIDIPYGYDLDGYKKRLEEELKKVLKMTKKDLKRRFIRKEQR